MSSLFPAKNFQVVRITSEDARRATDSLGLLARQITVSDEMYPNIYSWFRDKVIPGLRDGSRVAYVGLEGETPVASAIVKQGERAKFCHLRIASEFRDVHLGEVFFTIMALEVRKTAREIHFTLPEGLWAQRREFFAGFGFTEVTRAATQYRLFEEELRMSAPFKSVLRSTLLRLPQLKKLFTINNYSMSPSLVLAVKPEFARRLMRGEKTIEIRRKFHKRWEGSRIAIYSSRPEKALIGEATIERVQSASPNEVWDQYRDNIGCSRLEFDSYTDAADTVFAITLTDVTPYSSSMPVCQFEYLLEEELTIPQSHCKVHENAAWEKAVSIAALLHGCQRSLGKEWPIV